MRKREDLQQMFWEEKKEGRALGEQKRQRIHQGSGEIRELKYTGEE